MKTIRGLKIAAMVPLGFMVLMLLIFGIGEMVGGDITGIQHFAQLIVLGLIAWLGWKRPFWGGILLLGCAGLLAFVFVSMPAEPDMGAVISQFTIVILPLAFSGILLLLAHWQGRMHPLVK